MKNLLLILVIFFFQNVYSQKDTIEINQFKTTQILFDENINFVELGTGDLQVKTKIIDNVLIVQSIVPESDFIITNLFIKTDENYYNLIVKFNNNPQLENIFSSRIKSIENNSISEKKEIDNPFIINNATNKTAEPNPNDKPQNNSDEIIINKIIKRNDRFKPSKDYVTGVELQYYHDYIVNDKIYLKMKIENKTNLSYTIDNYYLNIRKNKKRNSSQSQRELVYKRILNETKTIPGNSAAYLIFEFDLFSINKNEEVIIEIKEKNGQRDFLIGIPHYIINKPIKLK